MRGDDGGFNRVDVGECGASDALRTKPQPSSVGCCIIRASICTSHPPAPRGSTWWNAGSQASPKNNCAAASIAAPANCKTPSAITSNSTPAQVSGEKDNRAAAKGGGKKGNYNDPGVDHFFSAKLKLDHFYSVANAHQPSGGLDEGRTLRGTDILGINAALALDKCVLPLICDSTKLSNSRRAISWV
jgi:hypothetical protein